MKFDNINLPSIYFVGYNLIFQNMTSTVMSVKTDKKLKEKAQKIAKDMGFPLSTLINAYLKQFVRNKTVHFTIKQSDKTIKALDSEFEKIEKDIEKEINMSPKFNKMQDAINFLKKQ